MQTLGLAGEQQPTDGLLKRLFWPSIENEYDVDLIRRQGFWLCTVVAVMSLVALLGQSTFLVGLAIFAVYLLAGIGVRQGSIGAALLVFLCYLCDRILALETMAVSFGAGSPVVSLFVLALLLSNIRGTLLARRWRGSLPAANSSSDLFDEHTTWTTKISSTLPRAVWPAGQFIFYPLGLSLLIFSIYLIARLPTIQRQKQVELRQQQEEEQRNQQRQVFNLPVR